jgi:hypothetical protein
MPFSDGKQSLPSALKVALASLTIALISMGDATGFRILLNVRSAWGLADGADACRSFVSAAC